MFRFGFKSAWRNILRHKAFAAVNVVGLAIGMAGCLIIAFWVRDELSFDRFHDNAGRIQRVVADWAKYGWDGLPATPSPLAEAARAEIPEIEKAARVSWHERRLFRLRDKSFFESRGLIVDPSFFEVFSFPLARGSAVFSGPEDIVVTETMAAKYFGTENPLGKSLEAGGRPWVIRGVLKDLPSRSSLQFDYASSFQYLDRVSGFASGWGAYNFTTFLLLKDGANAAEVGRKLDGIGRRARSPQILAGVRFRLQGLDRVHLSPMPGAPSVLRLGDGRAIPLFSLVAVFVLAIACANFVNLSTARLGRRAKEVGILKMAGAGRASISARFLGESFLLVVASAGLALALTALFVPAFNRLSGKDLRLDLGRPDTLAMLAAVVLLTGLAAGLPPALSLARLQPAKVLKRKGRVRRALVVLQFGLSILLLVSTAAVGRQLRYMRRAEAGFAKDHVFQVPVNETILAAYDAVRERLRQSPAVRSVSGQSYSFAETTWRSSGSFDWEGRSPDDRLDMVYTGVAYDYFETMGMTMAQGRAFDRRRPSDAQAGYILNETAVRKTGLRDPLGKRFSMSRNRPGTIIGVVKDARLRTFHHLVDPCVFYVVDPPSPSGSALLMIKLDGARTAEALAHIRRVWREFDPATPFEGRFLEETYDALYRAERRMTDVFRVFSGLAIFIAILGLLGLAAFMAEQRTREIGIRKILGSSRAGIVALVSGQLTKGILAANVLAWPAAFALAKRLLQSYAYRTNLPAGIFLIPSLAVFSLAWIAVALQSLRAASANPADALRHE